MWVPLGKLVALLASQAGYKPDQAWKPLGGWSSLYYQLFYNRV